MKMKRILIFLFLIIFTAASFFGYKFFIEGVHAPEGNYFYVKTASSFETVQQDLIDKQIIGNLNYFNQLASLLKFKKVKPGRYEVKDGMSLYALVKMLRNGTQSPVKLTLNFFRLKEDVAGFIGKKLEEDSTSVVQFLSNNDSLKKFEVDTNSFLSLIIPNTYLFNWNTSFPLMLKRLQDEQKKFWTEERRKKAADLGLTPLQVYILASIVEEETQKDTDKPIIASVYLNRLNINMPMQSCPTAKFSLKDFKLKRILEVHTKYPSPFNTYLHKGLPPGPICTPSSKTIDACLNAARTNYLYFVARPDFSGYSDFAETYEEHLKYAKIYQRELDIRTKKDKE